MLPIVRDPCMSQATVIIINIISADSQTPPRISSEADLHLPRILCLHGGGTNPWIFRTQCRSISASLKGHFRLIFAEAPFIAVPGPDVESVYAEWGPFRSWVRPDTAGRMPVCWGPGSVDVEAIDLAISNAIEADDRAGATGRVAGLLGFSQGAKMAACLLFRQQEENARQNKPMDTTPKVEYRFAVLLAGRGPLVALDNPGRDDILRLPTIHVHGTRDPGLHLHRELLHHHCAKGSAKLIEWNGNHRVPINARDVMPIVDAILDTARTIWLM
ncbi:serine hydrolase FSH [Aspergillus recurvatus]